MNLFGEVLLSKYVVGAEPGFPEGRGVQASGSPKRSKEDFSRCIAAAATTILLADSQGYPTTCWQQGHRSQSEVLLSIYHT